eukprot:GFUD01030618.1.p1 GENE.GFUD01030618.1~~GFUD01030618.1.p1  ORF type:complete len:388 (+),score=61.83 GFUD01030618.1:103-1164(+)
MLPTQYPLHYGHFMDQYWTRPDMFDNYKQDSFQNMRQETSAYNIRQETYQDPRHEFLLNSRSKLNQDLRHESSQDLRPELENKQELLEEIHEEASIKTEMSRKEHKTEQHESDFKERVDAIKKEIPEMVKDPLSFRQDMEMICQFCGSDFDNLDNLIGHVHLHLESMPDRDVNLRCMIKDCSYRPKTSTKKTDTNFEDSGTQNVITKYTQLKSIEDHMRSKHLNMPAWKCLFCDKPFNSKASLDYHHRMHNDPAKEYCRICKHFKSIDKIASHDLVKCAKLANAERKYECEDCGKRFKGAANLALHRTIHSEERFLCDFCGKSFTQKGNRKTHIMKKHSSLLIQQSLIIHNEK